MDWKSRVKNPMFWIGLVGVIGAPILAYNGIAASDLTTWNGLWGIVMGTVQNPYLLGSVVMAVLGALGVIVNPATPGISDAPKVADETKGGVE